MYGGIERGVSAPNVSLQLTNSSPLRGREVLGGLAEPLEMEVPETSSQAAFGGSSQLPR